MFKRGVPGPNSCKYLGPLQTSVLCLHSVLLAWHLSMSCLFLLCVWGACSSGFTKSVLPVEALFLNEALIMMWFSFTSLSLSSFLCFFYFCMCHAVRGKSLQLDCAMMSQIHKTLTSSFQLLFIIYHPYFIFLWEDLYGRVQAYMCCVLLVVCVDVVVLIHVSSVLLHGVVRFRYLETYEPLGWRLSSLRCESCTDIWLAIEVKVESNFAAPLKLLHSDSFHYLSSCWLWLLAFLFCGHHL